MGWKLDAGANSTEALELDLTDDTYYFLRAQDAPAPEMVQQLTGGVDADGDRPFTGRYVNRKITLTIDVQASSAATLETKISDVQRAVGRVNRDALLAADGIGGELKFTTPTTDTVTFDVLRADVQTDLGWQYTHVNFTTMTVTFDCLPFGRGAESTLSDHTETSLPALVFTEASIAGDVPALGRLVVDEDQAVSQAWVAAALRSRNYSSDADAALFYQAEGRTTLGGSAATASSGYSGTASGSSANVVDVDVLSTDWEAVLSTQATGGGSHLQHVGAYRVFARVQADSTNTGIVGVCLEWGVGDFRNPSRNSPTYLTDTRLSTGTAVEDTWILADLGIVNIPPVLTGSQFWEGRILAKSTVLSDQLFIDHLLLFPVDEFYAEAVSIPVSTAPNAYTAFDDFASGTYSGDLASDTLPSTGTWGTTASPYETGDFAVSGGYAQRTTVSDTSTDIRYGRIMYPSTTSALTTSAAQSDFAIGYYSAGQGVATRIVDKDNFFVAYLGTRDTGTGYRPLKVAKVVAGTVTELSSTTLGAYRGSATGVAPSYRMRVVVTSDGKWQVLGVQSNGIASPGEPVLVASGSDAVLATGGALATGSAGIVDWHTVATAETRVVATFSAWVPTLDAAVFASQSIQFRHDGVIREDSSGTYWQPVSKHTGDMLLVPPSGRESRTCEVIVKACRNDPRTGADSALDDISAQLFVTPRYLTLPT